MSTNNLIEIYNLLYSEHPKFHGREDAGTKNYAIRPAVLTWIINNIPANSNTLETGCGYSSVILTALSKMHTVISPFSEEHQLIKEWCKKQDIDVDHVNMIPKTSQEALPNLILPPLDFILIDGDHAFPAPFIDWYYTADALKMGGYLAVDDTQIPTGKILREFLLKEVDRWQLIIEIGNTSIFKRISTNKVAKEVLFIDQPYCKVPKKTMMTRGITKIKRILNRI